MDEQTLAVHRHPPIREQIVTVLREAITSLDLAPGQVLVERELCERTGASRPSVREGLRKLESEGLVVSRNGRGTVVRVLTRKEALDLYEVRGRLEGLAARRFCELASKADRTALSRAMDALASATEDGKAEKILAARTKYYEVLFAGAGNPELLHILRGVRARMAQLRPAVMGIPGRIGTSLEEFRAVHEAIEAGDAAQAEARAIAHVEHIASAYGSVTASEDRH